MRKTPIVCAALTVFGLFSPQVKADFLFFSDSRGVPTASHCNPTPECSSGGLFAALRLPELVLPKLPSLTANTCCESAPACCESPPASLSVSQNPPAITPQLKLTGTEQNEVRGKSFTRYRLTIENSDAFPNEMFRPAPDLPPCGKNKNSARTWVEVMSSDGKRLHGFCAFKSADSLTKLWFAVPDGGVAPAGVYVILNDRENGVKHQSNTVVIKAPEMGAGKKTAAVDGGGIESIYEALTLADVQLAGGPFSAGDIVTISYKLKNTSDKELRVPVDKSFSRPFNLAGTRQHWVERQGDDSTIPSIPSRTARRGSRYAAGGAIISTKATIAAGASISFQRRVATKGFPTGKYTYYIEYNKVRGGTLQTEKIDFELKD